MKIGTKAHAVAGTVLATIALIAAMIWWADQEVDAADQQRRYMTEIARRLTELRLVTFEYILNRRERARTQEQSVFRSLQQLIDDATRGAPSPGGSLGNLRSRGAMAHRIFEELHDARMIPATSPAELESQNRFEGQLASQLLVLLQENVADAFLLTDRATARIQAAQRRVMIVILLGLCLIAMSTLGAAWLVDRNVLVPISRLEQATREVAAGNWNFKLDSGADDEIGQMSRNFDAMTHALQDSFGQVQRSNVELAALNREIEAFSYSVSHDLRGPLRSMDGFSLALLEDYGDQLDEDGKDSLCRIRAASQRMGRLIDELLGLSRVTRVELSIREVDLAAIARDIATSLAEEDPGRRVRWEIAEHMVLRADKALIQIAMQNLLENAWKFTGKTADAHIRVGTVELDGRLACFVADNGVGFDMTYADRLFGAFQRLHHESEFSGTGIGLAIVHRIIHRHGGDIWAQAEPGRGATFFFTLRKDGNE